MSCLNQREQALLRVQQLGFMTDDLRLFLNTHPQCAQALSCLQRFIAMECAARQEYERVYGPLTLAAMQCRAQYDWICGPWPWEVEA